MKIILFGNRGSRPIGASADSPFERYGGDTTAIGIICEDKKLIGIDSGSGFWKWPYTLQTLMEREPPYEMDLFYSHYHDDHTMGIPQSPLLFAPGNKINLYGPDFAPGLMRIFNDKATRPANPDLLNVYKADLQFKTLSENDPQRSITLDNGATVSWLPVPHGSEKSFGYRVDHNGRSFAVISDTHHSLNADGTPILNQELVDFIKDADALVYDCHFSDDEVADNPAFFLDAMGHSTGEHGARLAQAARVPLLVTHHHDPNKTDEALDNLTGIFADYGRARNVQVIAAQPSLTLDLSKPLAAILADVRAQKTPQARYQAIGRKATHG